MRNQKGITLVALVITIIVLLILAGVSISLVVGQNGVLTQASNAVDTNEKATVKQDVEMGIASCTANYWSAFSSNTSVSYKDYVTVDTIKTSCTSAKTGYAGAITGIALDATKSYVKYETKKGNTYYLQLTYNDTTKPTSATVGEPTTTAPTGISF